MAEENRSKEELLELLKQGSKIWNEWRVTSADFDIGDVDLSGADLSGADLNVAYLTGVNLSEANLSGANLSGAYLNGANLSHAQLKEANLSNAHLRGANLSEAQLRGANLNGAHLSGINLSRANLRKATLNGTTLSDASLFGAYLRRATLVEADLNRADLRQIDLRRASLEGANLTEVNLSGAIFNGKTSLKGANTTNCIVDRYTLERLEDYGGLTFANLMALKVKDGVAELSASSSGLWHWVHLAAFITFVFPYAWFVIDYWSVAHFAGTDDQEQISLWGALLRFIYNGGQNMDIGLVFSWSFIAFIYMSVYNSIRMVLLWKTRQLELERESSGFSVMFSLETPLFQKLLKWSDARKWGKLSKLIAALKWGKALRIAKYMLFVYLAVGLLNTYHFLSQTVPVASLSS